MGIVQTLVTVGGLLAIIGLLALLFCHYLGGWTWTKAWLRSSGEEKMVLTRAGNPNGYMVSSESDLNISGRGSFRRFDTTDNDYQLFRQGSNSSLTRSHQYHVQGPNNYNPPQPLRPAPIPPALIQGQGQLTSQSSLDSVFNTAPSSPAPLTGFGPVVPKIPPPPQHQNQNQGSTSSVTSSLSHASHKYGIMGDGNNDRDVGTGSGNGGGGEEASATLNNFSSTNPFLPLLQASSQFLTQTMQSFQSGLQQQPHDINAEMNTSTRTVDVEGSGSTPFGSVSSSISTIPPGSAGLSMGEILFSAPPSYSSNVHVEPGGIPPIQDNQRNEGGGGGSFAPTTTSSDTSVPPADIYSFGSQPSPKHLPNSRPVPLSGSRSNSGSPQHSRYGLHHQNSAENIVSSSSSSAMHPAVHSPPPGRVPAGIRRASYPNRKEYTPHDTIPKSEFPQHIPYIPSMHHHHHHHPKAGTGGGSAAVAAVIVDRKVQVGVGVATDSGVVGAGPGGNGSFSDPLRHHHLIHHHHSGVQPFLEEQEEPPEEPCSNHQLAKASDNSNLDLEKEDLTNRIMLETMREEIRIANERMADATKSLMMDEVFLPTATTSTATTQLGSNSSSDGGSHSTQRDSPRKRNFSVSGGMMIFSPSGSNGGGDIVSGSISGKEAAGGGIRESGGISSALTLNSNSFTGHSRTGSATSMVRRSSTPNASRSNPTYSSTSLTQSNSRPTTLVQQQYQNQHQQPTCVSNRGTSNETDSQTNSRTSTFNVTPTPKQNILERAGSLGEEGGLRNNGYRNGKAVTGSGINSNANNVTTATSTGPSMSSGQIQSSQSGSQSQNRPWEGTGIRNEPSQTTASVTAAMHNSSVGGNVNNFAHNVTSGSSIIPSNRPPSVSSYFRQNSRSFSIRQSSTDSIGSDVSDLSSPTDNSLPSLQRAMSCDSVCSDTSVILGDLDPPHMTGHLCIGLEYDSETADLLVNVMEAKELVGPDPDPNAPFDSYVRVYLLPDKTTNMQTRVYRKSLGPCYKEKFMFGLELSELASRSLVFYLYATEKYTNTLIGEAELKLGDIDLTQPAVTWLLLTDTGQRGGEFGEIMFSLSYLPTAERLKVVVVKARNLKFPHERETGDPFVKVYLLQRGKKVSKKKSSTKRGERNPIFNEAMIFSIPAHALQTIQLRITVADSLEAEGRAYSIGHVIVGSVATGKPLSHWNQMLSSLRKPIAMWHALRK